MHTRGSGAISKNSTRLLQVRLSPFHTRGGRSISLPSRGCSCFLSRKKALSDTRHTHRDTRHPTWHSSTPSFPGNKHLRTFQRQDSNPLHGRGAGAKLLTSPAPPPPPPPLHLASTWGFSSNHPSLTSLLTFALAKETV